MILEGGQMGEVMGGYFIRRVVPPEVKFGVLTSTNSTRNTLLGPTPPAGNNTENLISPVASRVAGRGTTSQSKHKKSPLPDWYPRTPLRDITLICKAIQRMNMRVALTPQPIRPTTKLPKKPSPAQIQFQTPELTNSTFSSQIKPNPTVLDFTPIKVIKTPEMEVYEKKLTESIEKLERIVKRNMKREKLKQNTPARARVSRRDARCKMLMSMR